MKQLSEIRRWEMWRRGFDREYQRAEALRMQTADTVRAPAFDDDAPIPIVWEDA